MLEVTGNLWDYYNKEGYRICLTVNGTIKANGSAVMGRGCALEATRRLKGIDKVWGERLKQYGLQFMYLHEFDVFMFPVKFNWWEQANIGLIDHSSAELARAAKAEPCKIILPRPGCGNGRLTWDVVKPVLLHLPNNVEVISYVRSKL